MEKFDVIIIGGGPAGLVASKLVKAFGKSVAIVEAKKLGGDCTHTGCVPSKTLLKAASAVYEAKHLEKYGIAIKQLELDTSNVLSHVKSIVDEIYSHETPDIFENEGITIIEGVAKFVNTSQISVNGTLYEAKKFIIASGSSPLIPKIDGIDSINYLTNETIFSLPKVPESLLIVGNGVIAIEMATAFNRLGSQVTIVSRSSGIIKNGDQEIATILMRNLEEEGIKFVQGLQLESVYSKEQIELVVKKDEETLCLKAQEILFATGRQPNINLNLRHANVTFNEKGIKVNDYLQTTNPNIYAIGDVSTPYKFTHIAEQEAIVAGSNIGLPIKKKINYEHIGWCVYSDPEFAHIGFTYEQAQKKFSDVELISFEYKNSDRGYTDVKRTGLIKVVVSKGGKILGASILGERAGELIHQLQLAKTFGISFDKLSKMVYIYPTFADIIKQTSKKYYINRLLNNPVLKALKSIASLFTGAKNE